MRGRYALAPGVLLLAFFGGPLSQAVNPLDDDAGSGGDAGDLLAFALPVSPGSYWGSFHAQTDRVDFYAFQALAGDAIRMRMESPLDTALLLHWPGDGSDPRDGGSQFGSVFDGGEREFLIPYGGTWILRAYLVASGITGPVPYQFSFSLRTPVSSALSVADEGWQVLEARWDGPGIVRWFYRVDLGRDATDPFSALVRVETWRDGLYGGFAFHLWRSAFGRWVVISDPPIGELEIPIRVESDALGEFVMVSDVVEAADGALRLTFYRTGHASPGVLWASGDVPLASAAATGPDLVLWNSTAPGGSPHVVVPGASVSGPRNLTLSVEGPFVGFFTPHGNPASVQDPSGNDVPLDPRCECVWLRRLQHGDWQFELGATIGTQLAAQKNYLDGARLPDLGIAPSPP